MYDFEPPRWTRTPKPLTSLSQSTASAPFAPGFRASTARFVILSRMAPEPLLSSLGTTLGIPVNQSRRSSWQQKDHRFLVLGASRQEQETAGNCERETLNQRVAGSSPAAPTTLLRKLRST